FPTWQMRAEKSISKAGGSGQAHSRRSFNVCSSALALSAGPPPRFGKGLLTSYETRTEPVDSLHHDFRFSRFWQNGVGPRARNVAGGSLQTGSNYRGQQTPGDDPGRCREVWPCTRFLTEEARAASRNDRSRDQTRRLRSAPAGRPSGPGRQTADL